MILYYAAGGGLGHLTRARAVLRQLGLLDRATLLTASTFADDPRVTGGLPVLRIPAGFERDRAAYRRWLRDTLDGAELYVDSFPGGILGELCGMTGISAAHHVARRLRWESYEPRLDGPLPRFARTLVLEPLEPAHAAALDGCSEVVEALELEPPPAQELPAQPDGRPLWLVVHSGPREEVADLVAYADEQRSAEGATTARIAVVSPVPPPRLPADAEALDVYPAAPLFPEADRIFTACGFNAMHETRPFRDRHRFVPYERALDDQYARAAAARAG